MQRSLTIFCSAQSRAQRLCRSQGDSPSDRRRHAAPQHLPLRCNITAYEGVWMDEPLAPLADARDHALACALGSDHAIPILLVSSMLRDGLIAATHPEAAGVVAVSADPAPPRASALRAVLRGRTYRSPALHAPFADLGLTPREQMLLLLEVQPFTRHERAERMGVEVRTVRRYRQRLCDKLGLARTDDLAQWARTYLQSRARTVGD